MSNELITGGLELMMLGMGAVFVFLTVLIFATAFMSKAVLKFMPEQVQQINSNSINRNCRRVP